ncbi:hypothetical protein [Streptomyces sp. NPDC050287]|uniref:hypothetical protein n=1 Tax=Streptomyces sp. NPDC050287 TaxID=3365608 RepID=UPI0037AB24CA
MPIPYIARDDAVGSSREATSRMPGMPSAKDAVFYGGLGAMAVAGALEWPVALAVGGATWLLRGRKTEPRNAGGRGSADRETQAGESVRQSG